MSTAALISMITILGFVLGGFIFFLLLAIQKERKAKAEKK